MTVVCSLLTSYREWEALIPEWLMLWRGSARTTPFQHPDWLLPWWRAFDRQPLFVAVARKEGHLLAMLPFFVHLDPAQRTGKLLLVGAGTSDYLDGVFAPECIEADLRLLLAELPHAGWDRADLVQLPAESLLAKALAGPLVPGVTRAAGEPCSRRPACTISELPPKLRAEVRYHSNAARGLGNLELRRATEKDWQPAFDTLVRFHTERWERAGEGGVLADSRVLAHHREALPMLLADGTASLAVLRAGTTTLGVLYSLLDPPGRPKRTQYLYLMGHDGSFDRLKPGLLLLASAIEQAVHDGFARVDMLRGNESYKKFWRVEPAATQAISFVPETVRSLREFRNGNGPPMPREAIVEYGQPSGAS